MIRMRRIRPLLYQLKQQHYSFKLLPYGSYKFSDVNKPKVDKTLRDEILKQKHEDLHKAPNQEKDLTDYDKAFNYALGLSMENDFRKQLVVSQATYKKSLKQLRQAILFEDLLKSQVQILIYDTNSKPYNWHLIKVFYMLFVLYSGLFLIEFLISQETKSKIIFTQMEEGKGIKLITTLLVGYVTVKLLFRHLRMNKRYVQKIIYDTKSQNFIFIRRSFFGMRQLKEVSRYKILYTQNPALIKRGTNYLNVETKQEYSIGFEYAWRKQDLFSHLISQRIGQ